LSILNSRPPSPGPAGAGGQLRIEN